MERTAATVFLWLCGSLAGLFVLFHAYLSLGMIIDYYNYGWLDHSFVVFLNIRREIKLNFAGHDAQIRSNEDMKTILQRPYCAREDRDKFLSGNCEYMKFVPEENQRCRTLLSPLFGPSCLIITVDPDTYNDDSRIATISRAAKAVCADSKRVCIRPVAVTALGRQTRDLMK